jgi:hypothetical protein
MGAIFDNTPYIDSLKKQKGQKVCSLLFSLVCRLTRLTFAAMHTGTQRGRYQSLKDVFGEGFGWRWFVPLTMPQSMKDAFDFEVGRDELILPKAKPPTNATAAPAPGSGSAPAPAPASGAAAANGTTHLRPLATPSASAPANSPERTALLADAQQS